jgi:copper homeostasis protein
MMLEVCVDSVTSAINAEAGGADRLELCGDLITGGVTPSLALFERVRDKVSIPVHVLLRPRFGDFLYNAEELEILIKEAKHFHNAGADALVIGCLTKEGDVDKKAMSKLMEAASGLPVTFHRAFDHSADPMQALEDIIELGCSRILTSGCMPTAKEGAILLAKLVESAGNRIIIMPGCGVNEGNIAEIARLSGAREFHFSAREPVESGMIFRNPKVAMGSEDDPYGTVQTTARRVAATIEPLRS